MCNEALLENNFEFKMLYYLMFVLLFKKSLGVRTIVYILVSLIFLDSTF